MTVEGREKHIYRQGKKMDISRDGLVVLETAAAEAAAVTASSATAVERGQPLRMLGWRCYRGCPSVVAPPASWQ
jgi:hypothetical protein